MHTTSFPDRQGSRTPPAMRSVIPAMLLLLLLSAPAAADAPFNLENSLPKSFAGNSWKQAGGHTYTKSIVIYMETVGDARSFLSAAREVALTKPIIVIKPGRTAGATKAASSHTGSLTGSDEVLEVAFRRSGVLRVNTIAELFYMAEVLAKQPRPKGNRLTILTNAGGPGVLATDALITNGGELAEFSEETMQAFNQLLPAAWSHNNPVDIIGDASPERYAKALEIAAKDQKRDGMLVILTPQAMPAF